MRQTFISPIVIALLAGACGVNDAQPPDPVHHADAADVGVPPSDAANAPPEDDTAVASESRDAGEDAGLPDMEVIGLSVVPARYGASSLLSPITRTVVEKMKSIAEASATRRDEVFMKVGASGTVNVANLSCFAEAAGKTIDLDGRNVLKPTIYFFDQANLGDSTSFDRVTEAAEVGRTARWVMSGSPSPLDREIAAINPRIALVNYGTNDMNMGVTHQTALWPFWDDMVALLDELAGRGIIPIITGLNPRSDSVDAAHWVPAYNDMTRALAEKYQLPYFDLYHAVVGLPDMGLVADGIHGNAYSSGGTQACVFTTDALQYNYNVRNLLTLEMLHEVRIRFIEFERPVSDTLEWIGLGTPDDPVIIDSLPFSHHANTADSPSSLNQGYPSCDNGQDESGPEVYYRLDLDTPTALRAMVFDAEGADVDIHLLGASADPAGCVARNDRIVQGELAAGTHFFVVDTYAGSAGEYTLVLSLCEPGDPSCS